MSEPQEDISKALAVLAELKVGRDRAAKFQAHLAYLDASIPGPLVLRDQWEAAEWRKYSAYLDRLWNATPEVARAMEILRRRANAR